MRACVRARVSHLPEPLGQRQNVGHGSSSLRPGQAKVTNPSRPSWGWGQQRLSFPELSEPRRES